MESAQPSQETPPGQFTRPVTRRLLTWEIIAVFAVSLGGSALFAVIDLAGSLTAATSLTHQRTVMVGSLAPQRPGLDLALQLASIVVVLAPVVLVLYLLAARGESRHEIGLDACQPGPDTARGLVLAAVIGGTGLGLYVAAFRLGLSVHLVPESLPSTWWRYPVLVLDGIQNGLLEEVLVIGYLLRRLDQLGVRPGRALALSAVLRGSYHLYQGFGGFAGNAVMGVIFGWLYRRWGRVTPLIIAHSVIDIVAFTGYAALAGHVSWLP